MPTRRPDDPYILGRDFSANCRINAQYYLWYDGGTILHPKIPTDKENMRVAEIGVGTGLWLSHAARILPASAHLDGFDINLDAAPPEEWMPSNVSLHELDMLQPIPERFVGKYDIVHVQLFVAVVADKDPQLIVRNLAKLLKPGGYITWNEFDFTTMATVLTANAAPSEENDNKFAELLRHCTGLGGKLKSIVDEDNLWPARLPQIFGKEQLTNITIENRMLPPEMIVFVMDVVLMAMLEISNVTLDRIDGDLSEKARDLIRQVAEKRKERGYNIGRLTVIGQKPLPRQSSLPSV